MTLSVSLHRIFWIRKIYLKHRKWYEFCTNSQDRNQQEYQCTRKSRVHKNIKFLTKTHELYTKTSKTCLSYSRRIHGIDNASHPKVKQSDPPKAEQRQKQRRTWPRHLLRPTSPGFKAQWIQIQALGIKSRWITMALTTTKEDMAVPKDVMEHCSTQLSALSSG